MAEEEEFHGQLIFPFINVESVGGPYQDLSYAAGFELGRLYVLLEFGKLPYWEGMARTPNVEQIDIVCMRFNYVIEARVDHANEFSFLRIRKAAEVV